MMLRQGTTSRVIRIGGQIFAGILFTIYYYAVMWAIDRKSTSA